jgi:hypothetical protein
MTRRRQSLESTRSGGLTVNGKRQDAQRRTHTSKSHNRSCPRLAGQSMSFGSRLPVRSAKCLQSDVVVLPSPAIMRFRNSVVGVECSATNSRRRIYFLKRRGASWNWKMQDRLSGSQRFSFAKVAGLRKRGCLLWKKTRHGPCSVYFGKTLRSHLAIRRQKNPLGGHTDHLQPG